MKAQMRPKLSTNRTILEQADSKDFKQPIQTESIDETKTIMKTLVSLLRALPPTSNYQLQRISKEQPSFTSSEPPPSRVKTHCATASTRTHYIIHSRKIGNAILKNSTTSAGNST